MVQGGQIPDVVEMPDRWLALYANNDQLVDLGPYMEGWDEGGELDDAHGRVRQLRRRHDVHDPLRLLPAGDVLEQEAVRAGRSRRPARDHGRLHGGVAARSRSSTASTASACAAAPAATNGYIMMMANMMGHDDYFDEEGNSTLNSPDAIKGLQFLVDLYQNGYAPKDSVNWGFNEIVAGFYSGTCAMLDQDPDALIAIAERMPAEDFAVAPMPLGPAGKSFPTIGYAGWSMFEASEHKDEAWALIAHLSSRASNLEWSKFVGVIPIHEGAEQDPAFATEQYAGWFTELNDPRWQPTSMPTYLEEFGYFADVPRDPDRPGGAARPAHAPRTSPTNGPNT